MFITSRILAEEERSFLRCKVNTRLLSYKARSRPSHQLQGRFAISSSDVASLDEVELSPASTELESTSMPRSSASSAFSLSPTSSFPLSKPSTYIIFNRRLSRISIVTSHVLKVEREPLAGGLLPYSFGHCTTKGIHGLYNAAGPRIRGVTRLCLVENGVSVVIGPAHRKGTGQVGIIYNRYL